MATEAERNRGLGAYSTPGVDAPANQTLTPIITSSPLITFAFQNVAPPSSLYINRDDQLRIQIITGRNNGTFFARVRTLTPQGIIISNEWPLSCQTNNTTFIFTFPLDEGYLLSAVVSGAQSPFQRGTVFARAFLIRPGSGSGQIGQTLFEDYFGNFQMACFPGGRVIHSLEGPGARFNLNFGPFGAGAEALVTVPSNVHWRVESINATLVTAVAVANRNVQIIIDDSANIEWQFGPTTTQAASLTVNHSAGPGQSVPVDAAGNKGIILTGLPLLAQGFRIRTLTQNIQAADQWTVFTVALEEWVDAQ